MQLDKFLNNVAYLYLVDQDFQKISDLSGIQWGSLPEFQCVQIVRKYLALLATNPHKQAIFEMPGDLAYLEKCELDLKIIGKDEDEISNQFKKAFRFHQYKTLAGRLATNPEQGDKILSSFDVERISAISTESVTDFLPTCYEQFLELQKQGKDRVIIPGFDQLSKMIGGFNYGRVIMLLGETGFGKTNLAINLLLGAAHTSKCLFVNMEMPLEDIMKRLVVLTTGKSFKALYGGQISHESAVYNLKSFGDNLKFTKGFTLSLQSIESLIRKEKQSGLDFVVIDYDQKIDLVYSKNIPEWKLLQMAIQHLENVAKELHICLILLAQLNREGSVSSSHRATFTAHTILNFKGNDANTALDKRANAIIAAEKNRHGKKDQACLVHYNEENLNVTEIAVINYKKPDGVKRESKNQI
jgi:KaiC/GvpD/RAD55 family RecA-like ATPase